MVQLERSLRFSILNGGNGRVMPRQMTPHKDLHAPGVAVGSVGWREVVIYRYVSTE